MAITGTDKRMDTQLRDNLSKSFDSSDFINAVGQSQYTSVFGIDILTGTAGIKPGFTSKLNEAVENYIKSINDELDKLETNPNIAQAFKGEGVDSSVKRLITAVKQEAKTYTEKLKQAEQRIIEQVEQLYKEQSQSVSSSMNSDTSTLEGGPVGGGGSTGTSTSSIL